MPPPASHDAPVRLAVLKRLAFHCVSKAIACQNVCRRVEIPYKICSCGSAQETVRSGPILSPHRFPVPPLLAQSAMAGKPRPRNRMPTICPQVLEDYLTLQSSLQVEAYLLATLATSGLSLELEDM